MLCASHRDSGGAASSHSVPLTRRTQTIARRRYFRHGENYQRGPNVNERIRAREVRLIDENEQMVGVVDTRQALQRARDVGLDLVEVAADSKPPVCRILDFGKFKYEQAKKEKANRARTKISELKEVRMGRSMKIDPHDIQIRLNQARRFLMEGHKVQIVQNFRGREMVHRSRGDDRMKSIIDQLSDIAKVETPPRMAGRRMTMILAPDKTKVEQVKRQAQKAEKPEKDQNNQKGERDASAGDADHVAKAPTPKDEDRSTAPENRAAESPPNDREQNADPHEAEIGSSRR